MAVNLEPPKELLPIEGVRLASVEAGIRYSNRNDLLLIELCENTSVALVLTKNAFCAAPVALVREHRQVTHARYLVVNSGNANAGTGREGYQAAQFICQLIAEQGGCVIEAVLPFSTGVIGEVLPVNPFIKALPIAFDRLSKEGWLSAAKTIMTTDTLAKGVSRQLQINNKTVTITGIAKGSGMIRPDMATLLSYIATDALIDNELLQSMLNHVVEDTFNAITVDGDTSTNDSLVLMATGKSNVEVTHNHVNQFQEALLDVCLSLAQSIIRDAEGATKFITIEVLQAKTKAEARDVAFTVAHSPLVKTALFASDPNWGRILAAVGRAPVDDLAISGVSLWLGDTQLIEKGQPSEGYTEAKGQAEVDKEDIRIRIALDRGDQSAKVWTSDLSYDYVTINAEYRS